MDFNDGEHEQNQDIETPAGKPNPHYDPADAEFMTDAKKADAERRAQTLANAVKAVITKQKAKPGPKPKAPAPEMPKADAPRYVLITAADPEDAFEFTGNYVDAPDLRMADAQATLSGGKQKLYRLVEIVTEVSFDGKPV